jgi:hypothetical protein
MIKPTNLSSHGVPMGTVTQSQIGIQQREPLARAGDLVLQELRELLAYLHPVKAAAFHPWRRNLVIRG